MGWRFHRRLKLFPGVTMNMGKTGSSFSFGPRGAKVTVGKNGIRRTIGIPGTGLSYTTYDKFDKSGNNSSRKAAAAPSNTINVGFFSGLFLSGDEKIFVEAVKQMLAGNTSSALSEFSKIPQIADAAFISAVLYLNNGQYNACGVAIENALKNSSSLGTLFRKYNLDIDMSFAITEIFSVNLQPCTLALYLMKVEMLQQQHDISQACNILIALYKKDPSNLLVKISLAELILSTPNNGAWLKTLLGMTDNIENDSPVHTVLLFYRGMVLKEMKLYDAAQSVLSTAGRKKKDRDPELLLAIQEERAEIYELQGQKSSARKVWEKIYAEDPSHPDALRKINSL